MTLNDLYLVSQIIAGLAVIATLAALILSIRQNTRIQRAAAVQSLTEAITALNIPAIESSSLGEALAAVGRDWWSAKREQRVTAHYFLFSYFKLVEQAWYQNRSGVLEDSQWDGWSRVVTTFYHSPGIRDCWWPHRRLAYSAPFCEFIESSPKAEAVGDLGDIFGPHEEHAP
ncbi:hypothetical protein [Hyphobacterium sp.]|uniref:hypothetical protein n=1 Tax=Hyphobacterium sp. TaxID=2004662 RepID=UPI003BAC20F5